MNNLSPQQFPWAAPTHDQAHILSRAGCPECAKRSGDQA